jgi:hypothetical protein
VPSHGRWHERLGERVRKWQVLLPWVYVDFFGSFILRSGGILSSRTGGLVPLFQTPSYEPSYDIVTTKLVSTLFL